MIPKERVLIINALILTMNSRKEIIPGGSILIEGGVIKRIQKGTPVLDFRVQKTLDARGGIVMPGMINTHTHLGMSFFRSLGDDLKDRLRKILFPLEKSLVTEDLVYWATLHSLTEMIQGGVTTLFDMYFFEDAAARAASKAGVRSILGETVLNFPSPDSSAAYGGIGYAREFIQEWKNDGLITPAIAPHAPYTVDREHMKMCHDLACKEEVPLTLHLNEMTFEMEQFQKEFGKSPLSCLDKWGCLDSRVVAAHCLFTDQNDREILLNRGTGVAHNMVANIKSGKGVASIPEMIEMGIPVGLGSDGPMSGNTLDIISQMGYVSKVHKLIRRDPQIMSPSLVVELATIGGARALHIDKITGSLEPEKMADIVIMNHASPSLFPVYDPYSALVYGASPRDVDTVLVKGRILMENRRINHLDIPEIRARGQEYFEKVCSHPALKELNLKVNASAPSP